MKRSMLNAMLTGVQLWVPVGVLIFGAALLVVMR